VVPVLDPNGCCTLFVRAALVASADAAASGDITIHYGRDKLCLALNILPSVNSRALGKDLLYRVLRSAKQDTRQISRLPSVRH
jgi:hypothetical protein